MKNHALLNGIKLRKQVCLLIALSVFFVGCSKLFSPPLFDSVAQKVESIPGISDCAGTLVVADGMLNGKLVLDAKNVKHPDENSLVGTISSDSMQTVILAILEVVETRHKELVIAEPQVQALGVFWDNVINPESARVTSANCKLFIEIKKPETEEAGA